MAHLDVPVLDADGTTPVGFIAYPPIRFPWEPSFTTERGRTQAQLSEYITWLNAEQDLRVPVFTDFLGAAGAPAAVLDPPPRGLEALGVWIQAWFRVAARPYVQSGSSLEPDWRPGYFHVETFGFRHGIVYASRHPEGERERTGELLLHTLLHDLAFLVAREARSQNAGHTWQLGVAEGTIHAVLNQAAPAFAPLVHIQEFLVQSLTQVHTRRSEARQRRLARTLCDVFQNAVHGVDIEPIDEEFLNGYEHPSPFKLRRPEPGDPVAPQLLIEATRSFRVAGWFETCRFKDADLARAAQKAWRAVAHEEMASDPAAIPWRLLAVDGGRTWYEDVDAGLRPGDGQYTHTLMALRVLGGKGFGSIRDVVEDWNSEGNQVQLSFVWRRNRHFQLLLPQTGPYFSPALILEINAALPTEGARFWFLDRAPRMAIVTRATRRERDALEQSTGISLSSDAPSWWLDLSPIPGYTPAPAQTPSTVVRDTAKFASPPPGPQAPTSPRVNGPKVKTAQETYKELMRDQVTPALKTLGFRGSSKFIITKGDFQGVLRFQKSRYSNKQLIEVTVNLDAVHLPTKIGYWEARLGIVLPSDPSLK